MPGSRLVAHQLKMMNTQGDPHTARLLKLLHKFKSLSVRIDVGPFTTLLEEVGNGYGTCQQVLTKEVGMQRVAPKFVPRLLHHVNAPSCTSVLTQKFLETYQMAVIPHPPYFPDLEPRDFFLYPKMKLKLQGCWYDTNEEIQAESQRVSDTLTEKYFQEAFQKQGRWWDQCLHAGGNYFKGDGGR
jgi:hypothetical protein